MCIFGQNTREVIPFSVHGESDIDVLLLAGNTNVHHMAKVVSARFRHCEVVIFPFVNNKYPVERYLKIMQISSITSNFYPLMLASINASCLQQLLLWCVVMLISYFSYSSTIIN